MNNSDDHGAALTAYTPYVTEDGQIGMRKAEPGDWAVYLKADVEAQRAPLVEGSACCSPTSAPQSDGNATESLSSGASLGRGLDPEGANVIDNGNPYVFCDHVEQFNYSSFRGCTRGAGHNGPHLLAGEGWITTGNSPVLLKAQADAGPGDPEGAQ